MNKPILAWVDGMNPFGNPLSSGYANCPECDVSVTVGEATLAIESIVLTGGVTVEAYTANQIGLAVARETFIKKNVFMWGNRGGWHVHVGWGRELMRYHLPRQLKSWYSNARSMMRR